MDGDIEMSPKENEAEKEEALEAVAQPKSNSSSGTESMKATVPVTVVYGISASEMDEWRKTRRTMSHLLILFGILILVAIVVGFVSYQKLVNVLEVGIRVRGI